MLQLGNDNIKEMYFGGQHVAEVYYGSTKVWPSGTDIWQCNNIRVKYSSMDKIHPNGTNYAFIECDSIHIKPDASIEYFNNEVMRILAIGGTGSQFMQISADTKVYFNRLSYGTQDINNDFTITITPTLHGVTGNSKTVDCYCNSASTTGAYISLNLAEYGTEVPAGTSLVTINASSITSIEYTYSSGDKQYYSENNGDVNVYVDGVNTGVQTITETSPSISVILENTSTLEKSHSIYMTETQTHTETVTSNTITVIQKGYDFDSSGYTFEVPTGITMSDIVESGKTEIEKCVEVTSYKWVKKITTSGIVEERSAITMTSSDIVITYPAVSAITNLTLSTNHTPNPMYIGGNKYDYWFTCDSTVKTPKKAYVKFIQRDNGTEIKSFDRTITQKIGG